MLKISDLIIYPVKSLGGISLNTATVTDRGLEHDRRWMLINTQNRFLSQRELPQMALLKTSITADGISVIYAKNNHSYLIPFQPLTNNYIAVTIWDDTCTAQLVSPEADVWFSNILGIDCRLVYMPDDTHRPVDPKYAPEDKVTSFSDAYPFLLIGEASLNDLSQRAGEPIPMDRFRPNLVFTGGEAYAEDTLAHFTINSIHFYGVKLCARCPVPGIDQATAISGKQPLKTMAGYRRRNKNVWFGQNLIHTGDGVLKVGDNIEVISVKDAAVFD